MSLNPPHANTILDTDTDDILGRPYLIILKRVYVNLLSSQYRTNRLFRRNQVR